MISIFVLGFLVGVIFEFIMRCIVGRLTYLKYKDIIEPIFKEIEEEHKKL